ncbi:amidase [Mucilaginibacter boryungensis]|uniref:Amidase n=1 Tax=Mucilaginibacter boryungensis TaxID=768480 RepID=A0ABR9XET8_9SPHI|nr:amidase [Mucilaginibacter boryungensis]MBE9665888.1 amidase [Mucilaginibacter boryungensis]
MHRRSFLKNSSLAGLAITAVASGSCNLISSDKKESGDDVVFDDKFELNEVTIDTLQEKMNAGTYTSRSITELYLKRIEAIDKKGPKLNSIIELNPDALAMADAMDKERKNGKVRGAMHGIPVLVKDNIDVAGKMMTTAGALALNGHIAAKDAFIITQLREAGAVIIGKTNLSEWANFRSNRSTSAWSSRGGQTRMPYILNRNPSGSSSGSGSATAANLCTVAIGTETDGSVVSPSSVNGLVGIKPTVGLLSRTGIIPISKTQDTAGPMARTVKDAVILLTTLAGIDTTDAATLTSKGQAQPDYTKFLDSAGLAGKRIGIEKSFLKGNEAVVSLFREAIQVLKSKGAKVKEIDLLSQLKEIGDGEYQVLLYEFKDGVNNYLAGANAKVKSLADVIAFNKANAHDAMPFFKQETLELAQTKGDLNTKEYLDALKKSTETSRNAIDTILKKHKLSAIVGPTNGLACCIDLINGDYDTGFSFSSPAAMAGYPHITVPMGEVLGLPMGLSFIGTAYSEHELIKLAYGYEQASKRRGMPTFRQSLI